MLLHLIIEVGVLETINTALHLWLDDAIISGYGDSEGSPTEKGIADDTRVVYDYTKTMAGKNLVIVWGHSMGTG